MLLVFFLQYLSDMCGPCSLAELKAFLENRQRIRTQLIEDLRKKRRCHLRLGKQRYYYTLLQFMAILLQSKFCTLLTFAICSHTKVRILVFRWIVYPPFAIFAFINVDGYRLGDTGN